jgi:hypothetical protein
MSVKDPDVFELDGSVMISSDPNRIRLFYFKKQSRSSNCYSGQNRVYMPYKLPPSSRGHSLRVGSGARSGLDPEINLPGSTTLVKTCCYFSRSVLRKR